MPAPNEPRSTNAYFDAYDPAFLDNPYPTYARLRQASPVFHDEQWGLTFLTRHDHISAVLKDRERFGRDFRHRLDTQEVDRSLYERIYPPQWPTWTRYIRESFIDLEPPRHTRLRRLVSQAFTRRSAEEFRPRLEEAADRLLDGLLEGSRFEVIAGYATPLPVAMIAELMGIPAADHDQVLAWSHAIVKVFDKGVTEEEGEGAETATKDFVSYLEDLISDRRTNSGEDLITAMIEAKEAGDSLTDEEITATSILTLNAGHEATVHAIGNALLALARNPEQYAALRSGWVGVATAVDELLRFDSPLQMFERWVLEDVELADTTINKGTKVGLLFGSANHDPDAFPGNPSHLALGRTPNPHVSFGGGLHYCVGAPLARVEIEAALARFSARIRQIESSEPAHRIKSLVFRGLGSLDLEVRKA